MIIPSLWQEFTILCLHLNKNGSSPNEEEVLLQKPTVYIPDVCLSLGDYVSYTSMRKRVDPSVRTRMCVCAQRWCISWELSETVWALSDELMGDRERRRERREEEVSVCARVSQRERESCCYTSWHRPDPIETPTQGMLAVLFFLVLCGKILWLVTLLLLLLKLTTWTLSHIRWDHLPSDHQDLWVKNHAVSCVPFTKKHTQPERFAMGPRDQTAGETPTNETSSLHLWQIVQK